jgi:glyoxylase-like metal-dependent hydrolase (beta-lactamase superfamily II)
MSLYFDAQTNLLTRIEQVGSHEQLGDVTNAIVFADYRSIGNVKVPGKRRSLTNEFTTSENVYDAVKLNFDDGEKLLDVPAGFAEAAVPSAIAPAVGSAPARNMGDGVYLMEQFGYRVMFAEFDDYLVVLEAPTNSDTGKAQIQLIKRLIPNKPIKYVTFSHFHFDHTGGLREYIAEGTTIIVPPGNKQFVEQISKSKFTLKPDTLALKPRSAVIETLDKKRVFTDGKRTLELHSIGPTSHAEQMVMFYFPKEKILFQGDMFSPLDQGGIPPIIEVHHELVKKVGELRLDVETLIGVHSGALAWKDFLAAVDRANGTK